MEMRRKLLEVARELTIARSRVPSLNALASAAGVSKGGLVHHFPSRAALVDGLAREMIAEVDEVMGVAALKGTVSRTWLQLAAPGPSDVGLFRALAAAYRSVEDDSTGTLTAAAEATARWEALIAAEVGDPVTARAIRLLGDGITFNALVGTSLAEHDLGDLAELVERLARLTTRED